MNGEARDAEAGGNVFVTQKRIRSHPAAQFTGELASLLHGGLRHQYDEFISTVSRHHIRPAAILLQYVSDALQYHVAFQVSVKVVYELEAVKVHQDQSEWAIRACRTFPLGR